ncbi:MAG: hypothetical protein SFW09_08000 [Hyphomicrobiaceae bacterium]|nr:hypothetical protein [Hyphomicrobiaceae bacterium]
MAEAMLKLIDGPDKPALQWALSYPERETVHFKLDSDAIDVRVHRMDEPADGFTFTLHGVVVSGSHKGKPFSAVYSVENRAGSITLGAA